MKNPSELEDDLGDATPEEIMSEIFANVVIQWANMAYVFLGKTPNPETGQVTLDLDTAKYFIDQIEMLAVKTRGNLDRREEALLGQSLTTLRLAFVEASGKGSRIVTPPRPAFSPLESPKPVPTAPDPKPAAAAPPPEPVSAPAPAPTPPPPEESRKRFSKKY